MKAPGPLDELRDKFDRLNCPLPDRGWAKPSHVHVFGRASMHSLGSADDWPDSEESNFIRFTLATPWHPPNLVSPPNDLLERFIKLAEAPPSTVCKFAAKFGPILIYSRIEGDPETEIDITEGYSVWTYFARCVRSLVAIGTAYRFCRTPKVDDWFTISNAPEIVRTIRAKEIDRGSPLLLHPEEGWQVWSRLGATREQTQETWVHLMNNFLALGRTRPWISWEPKAAMPTLAFSGHNLLSYLALQTCLLISKHDSIAICSYCRCEYVVTQRAPKSGQHNYCPTCRKGSVASRLAQRRRRERLRNMPNQQRDL
jgi:hypothetical protein